MIAYWDASAVLPLFYLEKHSEAAKAALAQTTQSYSWRWTQVEVESGLLRRGAIPADWKRLERFLQPFLWLEVGAPEITRISELNRKHALRASDAGHLFCFQQASIVLPELVLVCFDADLAAAARKIGLRLWSR